jgi:polyadenylate-binding protein
VVYQVKKNDS